MSTIDKKFKREIDLHNLLKSESRTEWEKEHIVCYGLYDDEGIEAFIKVDEITIDSIEEITKAQKSHSFRARMNTHRNTTTYLMWLHKNSTYLIDKLLSKDDYMKAKSLLLKHGHKC